MLRVKCAHCGAGNQNVTETDTCFQCGNVLGEAPAARLFTALSDPGATVDLSKVSQDQMPPNVSFNFDMNRGGIVISQRTLAIAAVAGLVCLTAMTAMLFQIIH